jgi:hypothetical protein
MKFNTIWEVEEELDHIIELIESEMMDGPMSHPVSVYLWDRKEQLQTVYSRAGA